MSEWIKVKDQLPEANTEVLTYNGRYCRVAVLGGQRSASFRDPRTMQSLSPRPTHWMCLPAKPFNAQADGQA